MVTAAALVTAQVASPAGAGPAGARPADFGGPAACLRPGQSGAATARGGIDGDHRSVSAAAQSSIAAQTKKLLQAKHKAGLASAAGTRLSFNVPVYVHVMLDRAGRGNVTQRQIRNQIAMLNTTYQGGEARGLAADTGFSFSLVAVNRFRNSTWHSDGASRTYRARTRRGGRNALNIWVVDIKTLGLSTFPWDYAKRPKIDGIRVDFNSLPGGSLANYNRGKTAAHETGHWVGLWHTFQGGCSRMNDEVADTAAEASPAAGCPEGRDSCVGGGADPIHNYMDYSYDSCYDRFTPGQSQRLSTMWMAYRA